MDTRVEVHSVMYPDLTHVRQILDRFWTVLESLPCDSRGLTSISSSSSHTRVGPGNCPFTLINSLGWPLGASTSHVNVKSCLTSLAETIIESWSSTKPRLHNLCILKQRMVGVGVGRLCVEAGRRKCDSRHQSCKIYQYFCAEERHTWSLGFSTWCAFLLVFRWPEPRAAKIGVGSRTEHTDNRAPRDWPDVPESTM